MLERNSLPLFSQIKPYHVSPAIDFLIDENKKLIIKIKKYKDSVSWENFVIPLQLADERLSRAWSQVSHLNAVKNTPKLRNEYNKNILKITKYYSEVSQDEIIFKMFRTLKNSIAYQSYSEERKKLINDELLSFELGGVDLSADKKDEFRAIQEKLSTLASRFEENLLDATNKFHLHITDQKKLSGLPKDILAIATSNAKKNNIEGWLFTLDFPCYIPTLQYADDRSLRKDLYYAYSTKASELGEPALDNTSIINNILLLKDELAKLLDYPDYASMSLKTKMAKSSADVIDFLTNLSNKARLSAEKDMDELTEIAAQDGIENIEAWDISYYSEKIKQKKFYFSDLEIKNYFQKENVLFGLFNIVEKIYGIFIKEKKVEAWDDFVEFYEIRDAKNLLIGQFYLDLYARKNKRGGAWMDEAVSRYKFPNDSSIPIAYLTCNFTAPINNKPSTLTHDEVITLFHEFGHGLHHLLTEIDEYSISGIKGVEWDAVELPSQFMENFCWEWEVVKNMAHHIDTKEKMPKNLFDKLFLSKNFQSGLQTLRQVEFALFDMILHSTYDPYANNVLSVLNDIRSTISVIKPPLWNRFPHSFAHIFSGGYAAGYYSYKWAEVLSADAYDLFEEKGVLSSSIGATFRKEILARGGSRPAIESFIAFRGREPSIDALLRHSGLT